ncbi:hypothetical protein BU17DRAFT_87607 [Hysterangium stoloniferum]|nr:hypothetical protein BU17DRAFT_87607 [Hysterangium stoloniferum]
MSWLHNVRQLEIIKDLDLEKVQPMWDLTTAKEEELWILTARHSYLGHSGKIIMMLPIQILLADMISSTPTSQSFDGMHMEETYWQYAKV